MACHIPLESSQWCLQLCFILCFNRRSVHKVMDPPKSRESQLSKLMGQNDIWVLVMSPGTKYTIRGNVVASPKSRLWWILWVRVCPWFIHAPKCSNYALTNLLFGLCRSVWVIELLVNLPSPILELQHTLLPPKCYKLGNAPQLFLLPLSSSLDLQLNPSRRLGVHHKGKDTMN